MPRCQVFGAVCVFRFGAFDGKRIFFHFNVHVVLAETGDGHDNAVGVFTDLFDVIRWEGRRVTIGAGNAVEHLEEPVKADG